VLRVDELRKLGGTPCVHQHAGDGCRIHATRPGICRAYRCLWLGGALRDGDRPDALGAVLDVVSTGASTWLEIREAEPGAYERSPRLREIAHELMDAALVERRIDLVAALTHPLPVIAIAEMLGIPARDRARFKVWSDAAVKDLGVGLLTAPTLERLDEQRAVIREMRTYFLPLVEERRREPREDLLSGLVAAETEGSRLSFDEMIQTLILLLVAGNETTTNLIGNAVLELLAHPAALDELRADRSLMPGAIEEVLRFSSPVQMDPRRAVRATEIHGVPVAENQFVISWIGSVNRDEEVFERPDVFDIRRQNNHHLAFGFGPHYCLGASLASLEAQVAVDALLDRTRSFRRTDDTPLPLHPSVVFRGVRALPLEVERA